MGVRILGLALLAIAGCGEGAGTPEPTPPEPTWPAEGQIRGTFIGPAQPPCTCLNPPQPSAGETGFQISCTGDVASQLSLVFHGASPHLRHGVQIDLLTGEERRYISAIGWFGAAIEDPRGTSADQYRPLAIVTTAPGSPIELTDVTMWCQVTP